MYKVPSCARSMSSNIDELKRRHDLESLRPYVIREQCFPLNVDGSYAPITMEELKKLARAWKLHERRNFWKNHTERNAMVAVLCSHVLEKQRLRSGGTTNENENTSLDQKSVNSLNDLSMASMTSAYSVPLAPTGSFKHTRKSPREIKNYCGLKYFFREVSSVELTTKSKFNEPPEPENKPEVQGVNWRREDFNLKIDTPSMGENKSNRNSSLILNSSPTGKPVIISIEDQLRKHRSLSSHLHNYSYTNNYKVRPVTINNIQTFVNLSDTTDYVVALNLVTGMSNIVRNPASRHLLVEINGMHKITALANVVNGKSKEGTYGSALFYYYYSCESDFEDRIYNESNTTLQSNIESTDNELIFITLFTLNNLLTCVDRVRVAETLLKVFHSCFEHEYINLKDKSFIENILTIILNATGFVNLHSPMFRADLLDILNNIANFAVEEKHSDIALLVAKIINSLLHTTESSAQYISIDFVAILVLIMSLKTHDINKYTFKSLACISGVKAFEDIICESEQVTVITSIIIETSLKTKMPVDVAVDGAKYFYNISNPDKANYLEYVSRLVDDNIIDACIKLMSLTSLSIEVVKYCSMCLQNIFSVNFDDYYDKAQSIIEPLLEMLERTHFVNGVWVMYNISCKLYTLSLGKNPDPTIKTYLYDCKIHLNMLAFFYEASDKVDSASAYLQVLVQMCQSSDVVDDLLEAELLPKLAERVQSKPPSPIIKRKTIVETRDSENEDDGDASPPGSPHSKPSSPLNKKRIIDRSNEIKIYDSVSKLLLAVTKCYCTSDNCKKLDSVQISAIIKLLDVICNAIGVTAVIISQCALSLAFLTLLDIDYKDINLIVRKIITFSHSDNMFLSESLAAILYNSTCTQKNTSALLADDFCLNAMIKLLRSGNTSVQTTILCAMRTLCTIQKCIEIMSSGSILSDLIVIALLRTSSIDIKIVCGEAFYNMLCHSKTRLKLIKGEFWWGMGRLCREDHNSIRETCVRTLYDISCEPNTSGDPGQNLIRILRDSHVFSFIVDISTTSPTKFLETILSSVTNLINGFEDTKPFMAHHEVISLVRLGLDAINRGTTLKTMISAIGLLTLVVQKSQAGADTECVQNDLAELLNKQCALWVQSEECRVNICKLLYTLSLSSLFTRSIQINDLSNIFDVAYSQFPTKESAENLLGCIANYIEKENFHPSILIKMPVFTYLTCDVLSVPRNSLSILKFYGINDNNLSQLHVAALKSISSATVSPTKKSGDKSSNSVQLLAIAVFCHVTNILLPTSKDTMSQEFVLGFLKNSFIYDPILLKVLLQVIHKFSENSVTAEWILSSDGNVTSIQLLSSYLDFVRERAIRAEENQLATYLCSVILKNLSLHSSKNSKVLPLLTSSEQNNCTDILISHMLSDTNNAGDTVYMNIAITFYKAATESKLSNNGCISPSFVLETIQRMNSSMIDDVEVLYINKCTIGVVLEKFGAGMVVDPDFVQSTFAEMRSPSIAIVPSLMAEIKAVTYEEMSTKLSWKFSECISVMNIIISTIPIEPVVESQWRPVLFLEKKRLMEGVNIKMTNTDTFSINDNVSIEPFNFAAFQKLNKLYDCIIVDQSQLENIPFTTIESSTKDEENSNKVEEIVTGEKNDVNIEENNDYYDDSQEEIRPAE